MSSQEFFSIIVDTGLGKIIKAQASNSNLTLTKMAVGDSSEPITQSQTSMLNLRHKFNINSLTQSEQDPNILIAEGVIPSNVGGFYIHQVAVYDDEDELFAIAKVPATYKPNLTQGSSKDITIKFQMQIDNATNITLKVDNSVTLATRDFVITELAKKRDKTDSYSMAQSDERFLGIRAKAADSELLDGKDSSLFVLKSELSSLAPRADLSPYLLRSDTTESPISYKVPKYNSSNELQAYKFKMSASSTSMSSSYYPAFVDSNGYIQKASISSFLSAISVYSKRETDETITSKGYITQALADSRYLQTSNKSRFKIVDFETVYNNRRYVKDNPFGNNKWQTCITVTQAYYGGKWFNTGWYYGGVENRATGIVSGSIAEGIVVQTGGQFVTDGSLYEGSLYGGNGFEPRLISVKCRVLVFYIGELDA